MMDNAEDPLVNLFRRRTLAQQTAHGQMRDMFALRRDQSVGGLLHTVVQKSISGRRGGGLGRLRRVVATRSGENEPFADRLL